MNQTGHPSIQSLSLTNHIPEDDIVNLDFANRDSIFGTSYTAESNELVNATTDQYSQKLDNDNYTQQNRSQHLNSFQSGLEEDDLHDTKPQKDRKKILSNLTIKQNVKIINSTGKNEIKINLSNQLPPLTPIRKLRLRKQLKHQIATNDKEMPNFETESESLKNSTVLYIQPNEKINSPENKTQMFHDVDEDYEKSESPTDIHIQQSQTIVSEYFSCQLCGLVYKNQFDFFAHLKQHYEITTEETNNTVISSIETTTVLPDTIEYITKDDFNDICGDEIIVKSEEVDNVRILQSNDRPNTISYIKEEIEQEGELGDEFSETEDMLDGMQVVVDDVQNDSNTEWLENAETNSEEEHRNSTENNSYCEIDDLREPAEENNTNSIFWSEETNVVKNEKDTSDIEYEKIVIIGKKKSKAIKCLKCSKTFNSKNSYQYHKLIHSNKRPHICDVCGKGFLTSGALKVHQRLHSGAKPYPCKFCGRYFRQWGDMNYHIESLHSDEKKFQCEFCGKNFARRYSLVVHRRIHTGERNYVCEYCNKTFRASSYLQNHRKIHTGEKPHECHICSKKFRVRSDMKRHWKTHERDGNTKKRQTQSTFNAADTEDEIDQIRPNKMQFVDVYRLDKNVKEEITETDYYDLQTIKEEPVTVKKEKKTKTKSATEKKNKKTLTNDGGLKLVTPLTSSSSMSTVQTDETESGQKYIIKVHPDIDGDGEDIKTSISESGDIIVWPVNYI